MPNEPPVAYVKRRRNTSTSPWRGFFEVRPEQDAMNPRHRNTNAIHGNNHGTTTTIRLSYEFGRSIHVGQHDHRITHRRIAPQVVVRMPLIAPKNHDIARCDQKLFAAHDELNLARFHS